MSLVISFLLIFLAGIVNGSFALPTKYVKRWNFENIWIQYALWAFVILPLLASYLFIPQLLATYADTPWHILCIMIIGGFLFGAGQVGFAFAISMIGIGLAFVICLGLGTGFGFLLPLVVQHPEEIATPFGIMTIIGTCLALGGLLVSTYAGQMRDKLRREKEAHLGAPIASRHIYFLGVFLAVIAGLFSAGQNFSFSLTSEMQNIALQHGVGPLGAAIIMWPGFLLFTFIPYAAYMLFLHKKKHSFKLYLSSASWKYFFFSIVMGVCWFGSLIFYSKASQLIGKFGPIVGWPLFMVLVILTSNFWGLKHHEWEGVDKRIRRTLFLGIALLILSVLVLGYSSNLHT